VAISGNDESQLFAERDAEGFRFIDVGPLTMGCREDHSRTDYGLTRRLIYPKGGTCSYDSRDVLNRSGRQNCPPFAVNYEFGEGRRSAIPLELNGKFALPSADLAAPNIS